MQFEEAQTQELIDSKIMEHLAKAGAPGPGQVGIRVAMDLWMEVSPYCNQYAVPVGELA